MRWGCRSSRSIVGVVFGAAVERVEAEAGRVDTAAGKVRLGWRRLEGRRCH